MQQLRELSKKIKSNNFWGNLFKNSFYAIIGEGGASVLNLFVMILLIKLMGSEGYGLLILAQSYMFIVDGIINLQCWRAVIKYGAEAKVTKDIDDDMGYIKLGTTLDISTAILGAIIAFLIAGLVGNILGWSELLIKSAQIFSLVILFHFSGTPTAILRMEDKFHWVAIQKIVSALLKTTSIIIILFFYKQISVLNGVIVYAITDIVGHLILTIMALVIIHKKYGIKNVIKSKWPKKTKEFIRFTIWTSLSEVVDIPVAYLDVFIISKLSLSMVAIFKVFKQIISIVSKLTTPIYQAIYPQFSKLVAENKSRYAFDAVLKIRNAILKYFLPLALVVGLTSYWWLKLIFDIEYANYWYVLCIYLFVHTLSISYTTIHPFFASIGKVKYSFLIGGLANIVYIILGYLLVSRLHMLGIILAYVIQFCIVIGLKLKMSKEYLGIKKDRVVIVGGDHQNLLGVARSLGKKYDVWAIITSDDKYSFCSKSKYINKYVIIKNDKEEILKAIIDFKDEEKKTYLIPTSDLVAYVIDQNYDVLKKSYITNNINDTKNLINKYMDKKNQQELFNELGLNSAKSITINLNKIDRKEKYPMPAILKPLISANGSKEDITIVNDYNELEIAFNNFKDKGYNQVLLQEFLDIDEELDISGCAIDDSIYAPGCIKKIHIYPKKRGSTTYGKIVPLDKKILKQIEQIMKYLKYNGIFDIDVFLVNNKIYYNEINFRNGALSNALTNKKTNVIEAWIELIKDNKTNFENNNKTYYFVEEINELNLWKNKDISTKELIKALFSKVKIYYRFNDPMPFCYKFVNSIKRKRKKHHEK